MASISYNAQLIHPFRIRKTETNQWGLPVISFPEVGSRQKVTAVVVGILCFAAVSGTIALLVHLGPMHFAALGTFSYALAVPPGFAAGVITFYMVSHREKNKLITRLESEDKARLENEDKAKESDAIETYTLKHGEVLEVAIDDSVTSVEYTVNNDPATRMGAILNKEEVHEKVTIQANKHKPGDKLQVTCTHADGTATACEIIIEGIAATEKVEEAAPAKGSLEPQKPDDTAPVEVWSADKKGRITTINQGSTLHLNLIGATNVKYRINDDFANRLTFSVIDCKSLDLPTSKVPVGCIIHLTISYGEHAATVATGIKVVNPST